LETEAETEEAEPTEDEGRTMDQRLHEVSFMLEDILASVEQYAAEERDNRLSTTIAVSSKDVLSNRMVSGDGVGVVPKVGGLKRGAELLLKKHQSSKLTDVEDDSPTKDVPEKPLIVTAAVAEGGGREKDKDKDAKAGKSVVPPPDTTPPKRQPSVEAIRDFMTPSSGQSHPFPALPKRGGTFAELPPMGATPVGLRPAPPMRSLSDRFSHDSLWSVSSLGRVGDGKPKDRSAITTFPTIKE
jgi:hypothetical protein